MRVSVQTFISIISLGNICKVIHQPRSINSNRFIFCSSFPSFDHISRILVTSEQTSSKEQLFLVSVPKWRLYRVFSSHIAKRYSYNQTTFPQTLILECNNLQTKNGDIWGNKIIPKFCNRNLLKKNKNQRNIKRLQKKSTQPLRRVIQSCRTYC